MKKKLFLFLALTVLAVLMLAVSVSAADYDTSREVTLDSGEVVPLYDQEGNALSYLYVNEVLTPIKSCEAFYWDGNGYLKLTDESTKANYVVINLQDKTIDAGASKNCSANFNFYTNDTGNPNPQYAFMPDSLKSIYSDNLFRSCINLKVCEFTPSSQLTAFSKFNLHNCQNLTSFYVPAGVTALPDGEGQSYGLFYNCISLETVTFGEGSQLKSVGKCVFKKTTSLSNLTFPDTVESLGQECFRESGITKWPFTENSSLESLGLWCFFDAQSLESAFIPKGVSDLSQNSQNYGTFYNCTSLKSVIFQSGSQLSAMILTFKNCYALETITFDLNCPLESLGNSVFYNCYALKEVILPHNVKYVHNRAFQCYNGNGALETVNLGPSFKSFVNDSGDTWYFYKQPKLKTLIFPALNPDNVTSGWIQLINSSATPEIKYTGTLESWTAVLAKIKEVANNNNGTFLGITNPTIITTCEAFYENIHDGEESVKFDGDMFVSNANLCIECTRCGNTEEIETVAPLFHFNGFSYEEGTGSGKVMQAFAINKSVLDFYTEKFGAISYGLVAAVNIYYVDETPNTLHDGTLFDVTDGALVAREKVAYVDFTERDYEIFEIAISGLAGNNQNTSVYLCAYAFVDGKVYYLNDESVNEGTAGSSFTIADIKAKVDA